MTTRRASIALDRAPLLTTASTPPSSPRADVVDAGYDFHGRPGRRRSSGKFSPPSPPPTDDDFVAASASSSRSSSRRRRRRDDGGGGGEPTTTTTSGDDDAPRAAPSFYCPLTMGIMRDPVQDREGNSYERGAILKWLSENSTSPVTRNMLRRKHLVPNRALKEAIEFEETRRKNTDARGSGCASKISPGNVSAASRGRPSASERRSTNECHHHRIINDSLAGLDENARLDRLGVASLPTSRIVPTTNDGPTNAATVVIIDAPPTKETFRLHTRFDASVLDSSMMEKRSASGAADENRVLRNLLRRGRHKALMLEGTRGEEGGGGLRFGFEGKVSEIGSAEKFTAMLTMFVEVSFRMRKRIEAR